MTHINVIERVGAGAASYKKVNDLESGTGVHFGTSPLHRKANKVRATRVNWKSYMQSQIFTREEYVVVRTLDTSSRSRRTHLLLEKPDLCAKTFLNLLANVSKEHTLQYIVTMIDDILQEDKTRVEIFGVYARKNRESVFGPFLNMLNGRDAFTVNQISQIIAKFACWSGNLMDTKDQHQYLIWLKDQLKVQGSEYIQSVTRCIQMMLRIREYRPLFVEIDGVTAIAGEVSFQVHYQLTFCIWIIAFNPTVADRISRLNTNVIPILSDILHESVKESVTRIILATFRNLVEKPSDEEYKTDNALIMVRCKVLKQLKVLEARKFGDEELLEDLEFLKETLQASVKGLTSFGEYSSEVKSGRLEWSPVHKSEEFWRENALRLNEKDCELLRMLVRLLEMSRDPLVLSIAAHDIGEYVRYYPRGKTAVQQLGGKQLVMALLAHGDPNVRYEALRSVQKILIQNWEYLGQHLDEPKKEGIRELPASVSLTAAKASF